MGRGGVETRGDPGPQSTSDGRTGPGVQWGLRPSKRDPVLGRRPKGRPLHLPTRSVSTRTVDSGVSK